MHSHEQRSPRFVESKADQVADDVRRRRVKDEAAMAQLQERIANEANPLERNMLTKKLVALWALHHEEDDSEHAISA